MITYLNLCPIIHEHNYVCIKELPIFPIINGWQTFKVTAECTICKSIIETYVKKISNIGK